MGFLNNSGDIILDAVLTDTGRMRLAKGDGSFKISKFALGDDEVDYSLFNTDVGTSQQASQILQTPVFEAFTNNGSLMKSKLMTINLKNILYLPVMLINNLDNRVTSNRIINNGYVVAVDKSTEDFLLAPGTKLGDTPEKLVGVIRGFTTAGSQVIRVDQGLNTDAVTTLPLELKETQYMIQIDNRLGVITNSKNSQISPSYIDDDDIANYFVALSTDKDSVMDNPVSFTDTNTSDSGQVIKGPRGSILHFGIEASLSLKTSAYLFNTIGTTYNQAITPSISPKTLKLIYTNVTVTGGTTGFSVDVPIAFAKLV